MNSGDGEIENSVSPFFICEKTSLICQDNDVMSVTYSVLRVRESFIFLKKRKVAMERWS